MALVFLHLVIGVVAGQTETKTTPRFFDFVVVGGGVAGSVVASRLSESGQHTVLLIHEGGVPHQNLSVPGLQGPYLGGNPDTFRVYPGSPRRPGLNDTVVNFVVARPLGGGSAVNAMNWARGSPHDFDNWARITGDLTWTYTNMLKYFIKTEDYFGDFQTDQHGHGGPITISRPQYAPGLNEWMEAGRSLGFPSRVDPSGPQQIGFSPVEFNQRFGTRVSAYHGYIEPFLKSRQNLLVMTNSEATRILFRGNQAIGVEFTRNVNDRQIQGSVRVHREVIVCGGVMGSPILLMKSGVGPRQVLQSAKIPLVKDLPVGSNFEDHPFISVPFLINNISAVYDAQRDLTPTAWTQFNHFGDGPYTSLGGGSAQAFLASPIAIREGTGHWPDLQLLNFHTRAIPGFIPERPYILVGPDENIINCGAMITRTRSRGTLRLNPNQTPVLDYTFFSHPLDIENILEGIRACLRLHEETSVFQVLQARYPSNPLPACEHFPIRSDDYWRCYIRQTVVSGNHPTSTCPMGQVVDTHFRVLGLERLRIVDASVMPQTTNVNTQATVFALAEKAAEQILQAW